jgi:hypothetical protein
VNKKWLAIILPTLMAFVADAEQRCLVSELQGIVLSTHNPTNRRAAFLKWIQSNGKFCSEKKLILIQNRRAEWLGTADSVEIQVIINLLSEK